MKKDYHYDYLDKKLNHQHYVFNTLCKTQSMFRYHNLPDSIPQRMLERLLQNNGYACIAKVNDTLYAFYGGLGGEPDVYFEPTICTVSNPALNYTADLEINKDCVIINNDSYRVGLLPVIEKYSAMLVENDISTIVSSINTRITTIFSGGDSITKNSAEEYLRNITAGKLGVIADNTFLQSLKINPASKSNDNAINSLITQNQYIKACLLNEIGLSANTQLKKERLISAEVENNSESLYPIIDDMLTNRRNGIDVVNSMFGTNIEVELNSSWDYRAYNGMSIHNTEDEMPLDELEDNENETDHTKEPSENSANDSDSDSTTDKSESNGVNEETVNDVSRETKDDEEKEDEEKVDEKEDDK